MGFIRGSLTLPRMNAHRLVIVAAALTIMVAAALASALATFGGQTLPRADPNLIDIADSVLELEDGTIR